MSEIRFDMKPVQEKREKLSTKRSVYDPMIDQFLDSGQELVEIKVEDKESGYIVTQLSKRIEVRKLEIEVSHAQGFVYLEKKPPEAE